MMLGGKRYFDPNDAGIRFCVCCCKRKYRLESLMKTPVISKDFQNVGVHKYIALYTAHRVMQYKNQNMYPDMVHLPKHNATIRYNRLQIRCIP